MKLTELNPRWRNYRLAGEDGNRNRIGVSFDCPCGCGVRRICDFSNPLDGKGTIKALFPTWEARGSSFANLTLTPSINAPVSDGGCGWHGHMKDGELEGAIEGA